MPHQLKLSNFVWLLPLIAVGPIISVLLPEFDSDSKGSITFIIIGSAVVVSGLLWSRFGVVMAANVDATSVKKYRRFVFATLMLLGALFIGMGCILYAVQADLTLVNLAFAAFMVLFCAGSVVALIRIYRFGKLARASKE